MHLKSIVDRIDEILPQTQCKRCDFSSCRPYAEAIAAGKADIDRCSPGGIVGVRLLADLLEIDPKPLSPKYGEEAPATVAVIVENECIGCAKCIEACPVDAIVGAPKQVHTVIESECTGCELCISPCPVDCIVFKSLKYGDPRRERMDKKPRQAIAKRNKERYEAKNARVKREKYELAARAQNRKEILRKLRLSKRNCG